MRDLIGVAVPLIEAISSLVIVGGLAWALWTGLRPIDLTVLRREAAEAIVAGLSLKVAAALLNTIRAEDWNSIGILVAIVGIRTLVKWQLGCGWCKALRVNVCSNLYERSGAGG